MHKLICRDSVNDLNMTDFLVSPESFLRVYRVNRAGVKVSQFYDFPETVSYLVKADLIHCQNVSDHHLPDVFDSVTGTPKLHNLTGISGIFCFQSHDFKELRQN